ncbi:hypothetical protein [Streptomyces sp. NBC_01353]|uniref:hypothetical protein n=1 Tax=Streptomyces sp. NBC_01353 TaxID=2903835 RepID=UPI002E33DEE7|nr:hypothetical protein [Streptomyces sp. NBC_01353]
MHARDLARRCASVSADEAVLRAAELLAGEETPALLLVTREGHPVAFVEGHHLLAGILPDSVREDPLRATAIAGRLDDEVRQNMAALTVADVLPRRRPALSLVSPHASPLQMAAVMARTGSPVVAVVEYDTDDRPHLLGSVTAAALLAHFR